jgi:predicted metal-dependent peptidase
MRACCSTAGQTNTSATSVTLQCDIVQLHACLEHEVHTLLAHVRAGGTHEQQPTMASVNEQVVVTEMRRVLQHAVEYNRLIVC